MQALRRRYYTIGVYREVDQSDSWGNTDKKGNWQFSHNVLGFLQPRTGSYANANQANAPLSSHILYCDTDIDLKEKDRIKVSDLSYRLDFVQKARGIGGVIDHQEIPATYDNDIDLP